MKQIFPRRLAQLRNLRGLSQTQLASMCHVSQSTITLLESGLAKDVKTSTVVALCEVLAVSPDYLLGYDFAEDHARSIVRVTWAPDYAYKATDSPGADGIERKCPVCHTLLRANGGQHGMGECLVILRESNKSIEYMAALFGLPTASIDHVLQVGYEAMRTSHSKKRRSAA